MSTTTQQLTNRYGKLAAWVYHLDKPIGKTFGDVAYYQDRLAGITGSVLEGGVGNGRMLIPLTQSGLKVEGFDASFEMLEYCRKECADRGIVTSLRQERFANFTYNKLYEAIIVPAGSFQLITDFNEAIAVLKRFKSALMDNGRLIIDLSTLEALYVTSPRVRQWPADLDLLTLSETHLETNFVAQTKVTQLRYEHWTRLGIQKTEIDLFALRFWAVREFEIALRIAGFKHVSVSSNYNYLEEPHLETHTLTFEAQ